MATTFVHLGQARENSTNAVSVYSPGASTQALVRNITICNQTGTARTFRLFLDNDGTTYTEATALYYDAPITANETLSIDTFLTMDNASGNLAYRSSFANALTITVSGLEVT